MHLLFILKLEQSRVTYLLCRNASIIHYTLHFVFVFYVGLSIFLVCFLANMLERSTYLSLSNVNQTDDLLFVMLVSLITGWRRQSGNQTKAYCEQLSLRREPLSPGCWLLEVGSRLHLSLKEPTKNERSDRNQAKARSRLSGAILRVLIPQLCKLLSS